MAAVTGLVHIFRFTYRGDPNEEWSLGYHFKGPPPGDPASWLQLSTDVWSCEVHVLPSDVTLVRAYGYDSDDPNANHVWTQDYTTPGPAPPGTWTRSGVKMAGDQAALVQWRTARLNSRGKPIYLRKYLHDGATAPGGGDTLESAYLNQLAAFAGTGTQGIQSVHGGLRSRAQDDTVQAVVIHPYVTTRTLKRRGKRPRTPS